MANKLTFAEKIYNQILSLETNDDFMSDVLLIRKKIQETEPKVTEDEYGEVVDYAFYDNTPEYKQDVIQLRKKYNLSEMFQFQLEDYIPDGKLMNIHDISINLLRYLKPKLIPSIEPVICENEYGEEDVYFPPEIASEEHRVMIEIFPETIINDFIDNWDEISKERDRLYGIKNNKKTRSAKIKNLKRDVEMYNLKKDGKTGKEIVEIINKQECYKNEKIAYQDVSRTIKRVKERSNKIVPRKIT